MKKILVLFLVLFLPLAAFAQEPLSQEVLDQAKLQAGLFLELKNALGLAWMDDYNAYLEDPANSPQPAWASSVQDLINDNYLSETFPTDFVITLTGQEVTISRTITSQAIKDVLPIYLPSVAISGDTVSLLVQRPEQWVAWEAGLLGKVSRDGSDDPDILPNSVLDFGEGSEIRFVNNDGKISGVESLTYKGDELDDKFVNTSGDDEMSGTLTAGGLKVGTYAVWHEGNVGAGSGLDADLLDGQHGSFYQNASNLSAGIVPPDRLKGQTYEIDISGNAETATYASNSDKLDDYDSDHFATADHDHDGKYLIKTKTEGDTMAGILTAPGFQLNDANTKLAEGAGNSVRVQTNYGYVDIGPTNFGWAHFNTDRASFYFNKPVHATDKLQIYNTNTYLTGTEGKIAGNTVWHAGNDGSGSGLDADLLDGKHWSDIKSYIDANAGSIVAQSLGTNGYVKFNTGLMIQWGTGSVYGSNRPQTKNFPFPFPNAAFVIRVGTNSSGWSATVQGNVVSRTQYSVAYWNHGASSISYSFIAIGY